MLKQTFDAQTLVLPTYKPNFGDTWNQKFPAESVLFFFFFFVHVLKQAFAAQSMVLPKTPT